MMRFSAKSSFLLLILFLLGVSCHDKVDLQPSPDPAPVGFPSRPTCLIVKATYKTIYMSGPKTDYEQLTLNGKTYDVYKWTETTYEYDEKGRIKRETGGTFRGISDDVYTYSPTSVSVATTITNDGVVTQRYQGRLLFNAQGYDSTYTYNEQGLLLTKSAGAKTTIVKVDANNLVYHAERYDGGRLVSTYEFDPTHPGLPPVYQFRGVGDRNLRTVYLQSVQGVPYFNDGPAYRIDYHYVFDDQGRVKRQIEVDTSYPRSGWPFYINNGGIGVTDYEYECR